MPILTVERSIAFNGRSADITWFHPKVGFMPGEGLEQSPVAVMCCQSITGSDVFGQVHESVSSDLGKTWSEPEPIHSLGRRDLDSPGWEEGVCDFVPDWHMKTDRLLGIGHNVYYEDGVLANPQKKRYPVYAVRQPDGSWSEARKLEWDDPRMTEIYTSGCAQRVTLESGDIILPCSWGPEGRTDRAVGSLRCTFDGESLSAVESGNELQNTSGRGLLEPTVTLLEGKYYMTIRAEDDRGYVSTSVDGLEWADQKAWTWDNGEPLTMSTTQQRWLSHSIGLWLVYTRKADNNTNVMRWRAPLFMAEVDPDRLCLIRDTEQEVFPIIGDGVNDPTHVARMGNFMPANATVEESWITVGETLPEDGWKGDTLLARMRWTRPNYELSWRNYT